MIKKAMILAAGFGKRLNPLTLNCPKSLLKIGKKTLLLYIKPKIVKTIYPKHTKDWCLMKFAQIF